MPLPQDTTSTTTTPHYRIVLTGGPCGGKTTALARLSSYLRDRGFEVLTCPEAYSILVTNGMSPGQYYSSGIPGIATTIQNTVMDLQIAMEDGFSRVLQARKRPSVLLCDRGLMDGRAYMSQEEWDDLLRARGVESVCDVRDLRYNAVFHLVTAAKGAEQFYTLENNQVRVESPQEARELDCKTRASWGGHPHMFIFDNKSTNFESKLQKIVNTTATLVGLPSALRRESAKYLLKCVPDLGKFPDDISVHSFDVEKVYLYDVIADVIQPGAPVPGKRSSFRFSGTVYSEEYSFIRKRTHEDQPGSVYGQTTVKYDLLGEKIEVKRIISQREYMSLFRNRDKLRHIIKQKRITFLYEMQSFNVHMYTSPAPGLCILHCQTEMDEEGEVMIKLPPFLEIVKPLTPEDEKAYGSFNISLIDKEPR